eukprot:Skav214411  [mRNA]  locus=scaffold586:77545:85851:- [translate_table: standard]
MRLPISDAYALVWQLESKNAHSMKAENWSKLVLSRIETRATEGQLDQASLEQIDALLQVITSAAKLSPQMILEFGCTLRNLSPSMLQAVLWDQNFVKRVPYGEIENPGAYVHSMVKKFTRDDAERKILECIGAADVESFCRNMAVARYFAGRSHSWLLQGALRADSADCEVFVITSFSQHFRPNEINEFQGLQLLKSRFIISFNSCLEDYLYELQEENDASEVFVGELHMAGDYVKWNDNKGGVNRTEYLDHGDLVAFFSVDKGTV